MLFSRSVMSNPATPWTAACQVSQSFTTSQSLIKLMSIELVIPSNHPTFVVPFFPCLQSFPASGSFPVSWLFTSSGNIGASPSVLPMNIQCSLLLGLIGLISWSLQGTPKNFLQWRSSKASILRRSAFFMVQFSHSYMITGKTIALTILDYWFYKFYPFSSPDLPRPRDRTCVSCIAGRFFTTWAMEETPICLTLNELLLVYNFFLNIIHWSFGKHWVSMLGTSFKLWHISLYISKSCIC